MKIKQIVLLSIIPTVMLIGGLTLTVLKNRIPISEAPTNLRQYIGSVETSETELNETESEMLEALRTCSAELYRFHEIYSAMRKIYGGLSSLLICFSVLQFCTIGYLYKTKSQPVVVRQ
jgi:hypothetical protein